MKKFFKNLFTKEKWALVKTMEYTGFHYVLSKEDVIVYYDLYESNKGGRKIKFRSSADHKADILIKELYSKIQTTELYMGKLFQWKNGRYDPDIPRFSDMYNEDVLAALKGPQ